MKKKEPEFIDMTLIEGNVRIDLTWIGESYSGDYDPDDKDDQALLRMDVYVHEDVGSPYAIYSGNKWEAIEDSSYCMQFPALKTKRNVAVTKKALKYLMGELKDDAENWRPIKKRCEVLTHLSEKDL